jgi:predicted NAD/FAD-binding protein
MAATASIAVIGGGVSGLVTAWLLAPHYAVTLFEADERLGGHTHTHTVDDAAGAVAVDTGFIVFNRENYPLFTRLLDRLGIDAQPTAMSFSVSDVPSKLEWAGSPSLNSVFGQRRNLARPAFWGMLRDIRRFGREARDVIAAGDDRRSVAAFVQAGGYGQAFVDHYLLPLGASLWSCPREDFAAFPIRFVVEFLAHHRMLDLGGRPQWRSIPGGSQRYVAALLADLPARLQRGTPVRRVTRATEAVHIATDDGETPFDEAVLACHADQALGLLGADASATEREVLGAFPYCTNEAVLHSDTRVLPQRRRCWAAWNHRVDAAGRASVSYNMNILQRLDTTETWCVTLNDRGLIASECIAARTTYDHPQYTAERAHAQARHGELLRARRTAFCGAYWGYGFHEDGVRSAAAVADAFGVAGP